MTSAALRSRAWKLLEMVTTPLLPSDYLDLVSPLCASADLRGRIEAVHPETGDAATIVIRPGRGWRGHTAGQYVRIGVDVDGVRLWRAYSITSPTSRRDGRVTITVKAIPDGKVSNHLVRRAKPGTLIQLDQSTGDFVLSQAKPAKVLYLTAGSGITPVMGMLRDTEFDDVVMVHCAPRPQDVIFRDELHDLVANEKLRLTEVHTDSDGMLDITRLHELVPDWAERETWACGPAGLLDAAEEHWTGHGVRERLHTERFRPGIVVAGDDGEVTISVSGKTVPADGATPKLDNG
ncbi:ferredoxin reductase, partial [Streptomyces anulatus]|uniref:ferredoxin reductase n=1 Tax=Streptomyces anulatus TaxID=1892 RepID=UPI0033234711